MNFYTALSDLILVVHFAFVTFIVGGLVLTWIGSARHWGWVRALRFRVAHILAMGFVLLESLVGMVCPLTALENELRARGHAGTYQESFVQHWLGRILFHDASETLLTVLYAAVFLSILLTFWLSPPMRKHPPP